MRTTLSLDDDVAALLQRAQKKTRSSYKDLVNQALRSGLQQMLRSPAASRQFRTQSVSLGRCLIGSIDDVAEVLAVAEGESLP